MAIEITVPRLGWSMEEGIFGDWLKQPGEAITASEPLFSLESDKVTMDVESLDAGILHLVADSPPPGATVTVGQLLGYLLQKGEAPPLPRQAETVQAIPTYSPVPIQEPASSLPAITASPRARAVARKLGINLAQVTRRAGKSRIIASDVEQAKTPTSANRAILAARLEESFRAPHFYLHAEADAEALATYRLQHPPVAYNDLLLKAISLALTHHPPVNAYWANGQMVTHATQHVALAAQIGDQVLTPVITNPAQKPLAQITIDRLAILERCRHHQARPADFNHASATLSNLGAFGVDRFQAILNPPQSIIVAAGSLKKRPVVFNSLVVARLTLPLSLSVDHRVIDGVAAAAFLATLIRILETVAFEE